MKLTILKSGNSCHFFAKLGWKERFDPKEIELLTARVVPALIAPEAVQGKKNNVIQYDISSYTTLAFYLSCILTKEQFMEIVEQCIALFRQMQAAYFNCKNLVFDFEQIYVLLADRSLHFIYLPILESKREIAIPAFFRRLAQNANRSTYEQVNFVERYLAFLDRPTPFILNEFERFVKLDGQWEERATSLREGTPQQAYIVEKEKLPLQSAKQPELFFQRNMGGTVLLDGCAGTVLLEDTSVAYPHLLRTKTDESILINKIPFCIGKEFGQVDYCVTDNGAVSRRHAEIRKQQDGYYLVDLKSTNKTYINQCALLPEEPYKLENGVQIRLGNESFTFLAEDTVQ